MIDRIRIRGFRGIESLDFSLVAPTVLIGANSTGKSTVISALELAYRGKSSSVQPSDFFTDRSGKRAPKIQVDLRFVPVGPSGQRLSSFPPLWRAALGEAISADPENGQEFYAFRTTVRRQDGRYVLRRWNLRRWKGADPQPVPMEKVPDCLQLAAIGPETNLRDELLRPESFLGNALLEVGADACATSGDPMLFDRLRTTLDMLAYAAGEPASRQRESLQEVFAILRETHLPRSARSLLRSGCGRFALLLSLILLSEAACEHCRRKKLPLHILAAVEEPELHLHPNAQRSLALRLQKMPSQLVMTTHSPFVAGAVDPRHYRFMDLGSRGARARWLPSSMPAADIREIRRQILRSRGEILFSAGLILAEGITEEQLLHGMFLRYFGHEASDFGISIIGVEGKNYPPFLRMAVCMQRPFLVISDNDGDTEAVLLRQKEKILQEQGFSSPKSGECLFFLTKGLAMEGELLAMPSMREEIALALARMTADKARKPQDWIAGETERLLGLPVSSLKKKLENSKSEYSGFLGSIICENPFEKQPRELIPGPILRAFREVEAWIGRRRGA